MSNSKSPRFQTKEEAVVEFYGRSGVFKAKLKNISQTGACLEWLNREFNLEKGDLLRMNVNLKAVGKSHSFNAEVIWSKNQIGGVQFIRQEQLIEKMMSRI